MGSRRIEFLQEALVFDDEGTTPDGRVVTAHYELAPGAQIRAHFHPGHGEYFEVISGTVHLSCESGERVLQPGQSFSLPQSGWHSLRNDGPDRAFMVGRYDPRSISNLS